MAVMSEIDAIRELERILSSLEDPAVRKRVLDWACSKYSLVKPKDPTTADTETPAKKAKDGGKKRKHKKVERPALSIVKELNLKPKDKKSFRELVNEKQPKDRQDVASLAVYYLQKVLETPNISINHIYTCFKDIGYRVFSYYDRALRNVSARKGWIDTKDLNDIKMTPVGENYIEHDLPRAAKQNSK